MSAVELQDRRFTEEEYLDLCLESMYKYEYNDGVVTMMAGGTPAHNQAKRNLYNFLLLNKGECQLFDSDTAIHVEDVNRYFFADMSGLCGPTYLSDKPGIERLLNPQLIIEVQSKSTATYDQGEKFAMYRHLPSLREYITVDSQHFLVSTYYRDESGNWRIGNYYRLDQEVKIITFGVSVPMSTIYEGVTMVKD